MNPLFTRITRKLLTLLLLPLLLLAHGLFAQEVSDWKDEMAAFAKADSLNPPPKGGIVFTGSSSIRIWENLNEQFPDRKIINRGFGGSQLEDVITMADQVIFAYAPRQVVIYAGDNDLADGKSAEEVAVDVDLLFRTIHSRLPSANIVFISLKPSPARIQYLDEARKANQLIKKIVRREGNAIYLDVFSDMLDANGKPQPDLFRADSLHMNEKGYQQWARLLKPHLIK